MKSLLSSLIALAFPALPTALCALALVLTLAALPATLCAQTDRPAGASSIESTDVPPSSLEPDGDVRSYGGYLLDMTLMGLAEPQPAAVHILDMPFPLARDYSRMFAPSGNATFGKASYGQAFSTGRLSAGAFSAGGLRYYGPATLYGSACVTCGTTDLQMGSFRLGNGMRLQTYGQYNADGYRVHSPSALPWEKNQFRGAFELKSSNGAWGIRVEVQHR